MSIASVLIPSDKPDGGPSAGAALLPAAVHRPVPSSRPRSGCATTSSPAHPASLCPPGATGRRPRDVDRFDEYCDHLLVRDDDTGELVGCYRMLAPAGAIAAGGLYTATEFDVDAFDPLRSSLVEMGRAVVRDGHRNGGVVLLMWAGILAYLDKYGYDYVTGCVSVPIGSRGRDSPGSQLRGVRDFILTRHAAPPQYAVRPLPARAHRRENPRRHCAAAAADRSAADARLPAAGRSGLRRTGARSGLRGRRLLRAAGQTASRYPISQAIAVGVGGFANDRCHAPAAARRPPPQSPPTPGCRAPRATPAA